MTHAGSPLLTPAAFRRTVYPTSRVSSVARSQSRKVSPKEIEDCQVLHYSIPNVQQYGMGIMEDGSGIDSDKWLIERAVVLVSRLNPRKGVVIHVDHGGEFAVASTEFVPLCTGDKGDDRLLAYILGSQVVASYLDSMTRSTTRSHQRVQSSQIRALGVPWAKNAENRRAIVDFLDRETAQIDAMIEAQVLLLRSLRERLDGIRRRALFSLRDEQSMRPLKRLSRRESGAAFPLAEQGEVGLPLPFYKVACLGVCTPEGVVVIEPDTIARATAKRLGARIIPAGASLMAKIGAASLLGRVGIVTQECCIDNNMVAFVPREGVESRYLYHVLSDLDVYPVINHSVIPYMNERAVMDTRVPWPSLTMQREVVASIDAASAKMSEVIEATAATVDFMRERREALITAAVTGRIDPKTGSERVAELLEKEAP